MKGSVTVSTTALIFALRMGECTPLHLKRAGDHAISSCGDIWMPRDNVRIGQGTDERDGYNSAVDNFCAQASGKTLPGGDSYLSLATGTELNFGKPPSEYGQWGFVNFEIHNRQDIDHTVDENDCKEFLKHLSEDGGRCSGPQNTDSKGGTWQVINGKLSYHALPSTTPPEEDAFNTLYTGVIHPQSPNTGSSSPLDPIPYSVTKDIIKPVNAHSHNDYEQGIPLFAALFTGCISAEVDVFLRDGEVIIGHNSPKSGRTLRAQYVQPLRDILDANGGVGVYASAPDAPSFTLLVDFKTDDSGTLDAVVAALEPLREGGYLSRVEDGRFVEKQVTVVASGSAPFDRIDSGDGVPERDVFYDAKVDDLGARPYSDLNSYYASAQYSSAGNEEAVRRQVQAAHDLGLKVRYYALPSEDIWEDLMAWGVDRLNADDLANTARLPRL